MAAKLIVSEIRSIQFDLDTYPSISEMQSSDTTPPLLCLLLKNIVGSQFKQFSIAQCILQAARPRTFMAPLLLGLGIQLDHSFGSKFLLQQLSKLGMTVSYDEVECYCQSVLSERNPDSSTGCSFPSGITQWMADNVDHNIRTLDGHDSFHGMGIISASVSLDGEFGSLDTRIPHLKQCLLASETCANHVIPMHVYNLPKKKGLCSVTMRDIRALQQPITLPQILQLDTVWHLSWEHGIPAGCRPNWGGFIQSACIGMHAPPATINMLPLIDMRPSDETCLYSTLLFVDTQARKPMCMYHIRSATVVEGCRNYEGCCTEQHRLSFRWVSPAELHRLQW